MLPIEYTGSMGMCIDMSIKSPYLDILLQDNVESREEVLLQFSNLADVSSGRVLDERCDTLKEVVVEARLCGVLAHLQQHGSKPLQAHCGHTSNLHSTAAYDGRTATSGNSSLAVVRPGCVRF